MDNNYEATYREKRGSLSTKELRERKERSTAKFRTIGEMKQHHNAIQTLYKNGYDGNALRHIAGEFQDSIQFALDDINRMRDNMSEILNS